MDAVFLAVLNRSIAAGWMVLAVLVLRALLFRKVLVGREIASAPTVLLTAYAVRGLDINSSYTIYDLINKQKKNGVAVIYVGEDLDVLLELADRILVLCGGKVSGIVPGRGAKKRDVGMMMTKLGGNAHE